MFLSNIIENLTGIDSLVSFATISTMVLGAISLFIANMGRFIQAKKFGIPIRAIHQANISDSADLWVALVGTLGFGIFVPFVMLTFDINIWTILPVVFVTFILGLFFTKSLLKIKTNKKVIRDGKEYAVTRDFPFILVACIALITAIAYMRLHYVYINNIGTGASLENGLFNGFMTITALVVQIGYTLILLILLFLNVLTRISGNRDIMTTSIDGQDYIISMRHNIDKWILQPCEIMSYESFMNKASSLHDDIVIILFEKGVFIIRDLSTLPEPIKYHANSGMAEKGHLNIK